MWKSGWKINKDWVKGKEKWMLLLVCGLILLILSFPPGSKKDKEEEAGSPVVQGQLVPEAKEGDSDSQTAAGKISGTQEDEERRYEKEMEQRVKDILKNVDGVGEVDVMLTLKSSKEKVLHVDRDRSRSTTEEKDSAGGTRKSQTEEMKESSLTTGTSGTQEPVIEKELQPEIEGIIISARGGGSAQVKAEISEAMEALFRLPAHKIKVLKRVE